MKLWSYKDFLNKHIETMFNFKEINEEDVLKIIQKLKPKISFGHDGLSTVLLKFIANDIISILTLIINQSLTTGIFPDKLKIAKIKPIYKKTILIYQTTIARYHCYLQYPKYSKK